MMVTTGYTQHVIKIMCVRQEYLHGASLTSGPYGCDAIAPGDYLAMQGYPWPPAAPHGMVPEPMTADEPNVLKFLRKYKHLVQMYRNS